MLLWPGYCDEAIVASLVGCSWQASMQAPFSHESRFAFFVAARGLLCCCAQAGCNLLPVCMRASVIGARRREPQQRLQQLTRAGSSFAHHECQQHHKLCRKQITVAAEGISTRSCTGERSRQFSLGSTLWTVPCGRALHPFLANMHGGVDDTQSSILWCCVMRYTL